MAEPIKKRLIRMALLTSPILAVYNTLPLLLFMHAYISTNPDAQGALQKYPFALFFVTINIFVQWLINICIRDKFKPTLRYAISYGIVLGIMALLSNFMPRPEHSPINIGFLRFYPYLGVIANNTFILLIINRIKTEAERTSLRLQKNELELSNLIVKHEQLKQQIHPHFLFNCLSNLRALIRIDADRAVTYSEKLSHFLRISLQSSDQNKATLSDELNFLRLYFDLQKVRFGEAIEMHLNIPESLLNSTYLPIFSLQILAENAMKHNQFSPKKPLSIKISVKDEYITIQNNVLLSAEESSGTGIGLKNLKERFALLNQPEPIFILNEKQFTAQLKLIK
ncbi:MAG: histidine kinase [Flavobacteriales bacterium]|nr:histidine kinase [Flavobacteriales bacterium]